MSALMTMPNRTITRLPPHPNDLDRRRIERALEQRKRYRYVSPNVAGVAGGYRIDSPCCSRNIDPDGGIVDVALMLYDIDRSIWHLFRKNHSLGTWEFDSHHARLVDLLERVNVDSERTFWQ